MKINNKLTISLNMNNNDPVLSSMKSKPNSLKVDVLKKIVKVSILCLPIMLLSTMAYSFNATDVITSYSVTDSLESPNKAIIGFGFVEQKIHLIALAFMAFLTYMGHRENKPQIA